MLGAVLPTCRTFSGWHICLVLRIIVANWYSVGPEAFEELPRHGSPPRLRAVGVARDEPLPHSGEQHVLEPSGLSLTATTRGATDTVVVVGSDAPLDLLKRTKSEAP